MAGADREEVVHPGMKVAEVLARWPHLLEVLVEASPAFQKLKNPLLRRTMPALVTVAQAARIGGLEPEELVARLNRALGKEGAPQGGGGEAESLLGTPPPPWLAAPVGFHLDVRPILEAGGEPFSRILAAAREVKPGERLVLEVLFEPIPLYRVLAKQGFWAWCERIGERHYRAHFYRQGMGGEEGLAKAPPLTEADWEEVQAEVTIEENLEPPLPMMRVLEALASLKPGEKLLVHHVRRPVHLLARLEEEGHAYALKDLGPGRVKLLIRKGG
ncbi:hypothetical protein CSW25_07565 [Thermus scotoductus]|uniref:DUF2249 domain-containing protein n=11 Tax=Thermus scotoductus TaxID=37636 RepID=A0ABY0AI29_THESC|nr:DUF2249 domain-containing protein [Thermus scotoductus]RTH08297.1 hypothetical protein CSW46_08695 [Thermus scotoductus]RTH19103.1 hypothetical protein CSW39_03405 [Thermus scotoductus]RTH30251.1 hypothetical protein CSW35_10990 [Thermus scotoductus]RTH36673.1 hypothetical protein CSW34_10495 [Thermus scotoductus]RTH38190.1 hypothetical protein CSW32_07920 [Thermus scotoductus]